MAQSLHLWEVLHNSLYHALLRPVQQRGGHEINMVVLFHELYRMLVIPYWTRQEDLVNMGAQIVKSTLIVISTHMQGIFGGPHDTKLRGVLDL